MRFLITFSAIWSSLILYLGTTRGHISSIHTFFIGICVTYAFYKVWFRKKIKC
jgi:hypothetical protein